MGIVLVIAIGVVLSWHWSSWVQPTARIDAPLAAAFGAAGALIGAFLSCALTQLPVSDVHATTLLGSAIGTAGVLLVASRVFARQARQTHRTQA